MSDVRFFVRRYLDEGFGRPHPIPRGEKGPRISGWNNPETKYEVKDFEEDDNVGTALTGDLVDVDVDAQEAVQVAHDLMLRTDRIHGRPGKPTSHYWFRCEGAKSYQWKDIPRPDPTDPTGKKTKTATLIEIRAGSGHQTVLPPSFRKYKDDEIPLVPGTDGETLSWEANREPANVEYKTLRHHVRLVATAALLAKCWPAGVRHFAALDIAGFLTARGLTEKDIVDVIRAAATAAGDNEVDDRVTAAKNTYNAFHAGAKTSGGPSLAEKVGQPLVNRLTEWFGGNTAVHDGVIEEMNRMHFVVRVGKDDVIGTVVGDQVYFQQERSLALRYANQVVKIGEHTRGAKKGQAIEETKFNIWKKHPKRQDYRAITFAPPPLAADPRDYNLWKGFAVKPLECPERQDRRTWLKETVVPTCSRYLTMVHDVICGGEPDRQEEYFNYLLDLMALTVQRPGEPSEVAVVLKGERGAGKGMFIRNFGALFGRHYVHISKPEQVVGKFNAACSGKVVIFADEAFYAGDKKDLGALKVLITEPVISIERKGIDPVQEPNFAHLFMATNEDWAIPAGFQERRFFALLVSSIHLQDADYFDAIAQEMKNGGREALLTYLLHRPISDERRKELRNAPRTAELGEQQEKTLAPELKWWKERLYEGSIGVDGDWPSEITTNALHQDYLLWCDSMKINRRVTLVDLGRRVLAPWLKERVKFKGVAVRPLLPLAEARRLFDEKAGTTTSWPSDEEGQAPTVERQPEGGKGLPF